LTPCVSVRRRRAPGSLRARIQPSIFFSAALTSIGFALPRVAAIALPTTDWNAFS
jgi:hypothetical protein